MPPERQNWRAGAKDHRNRHLPTKPAFPYLRFAVQNEEKNKPMTEVVVIGLDSLKALLGEELERLRLALEIPQGTHLEAELPKGCRRDLPRLMILLSLPTWDAIVRASAQLKVDLRDLNESEMAWAENVKTKTVQGWRMRGTGPPYRNQAGLLAYPVRWYYEWRENGRQSSTSQGTRRGRKIVDWK